MEGKEEECPVCQRSFLKSHLKRHMNVHREREYKCSKCQKTFTRKSNLVRHMLLHTGQKPFKCSQCPKTFSEKSNLIKHMTIHSREKPFKCSYCEKTFSMKVLLVNHMTVHTRENPYECTECQKTFRVWSKLMQHMTVHTGKSSHTEEKLYKCSQCQMTFFERCRLQWHMRGHFVRHIKIHKQEKPFTSDHSDKGFHCKGNQTCHPSFCSKCDYNKMTSSQQTPEEDFVPHPTRERFGSPEVVKQEVGTDSFMYKTDSCTEVAVIEFEPFVKTEMDDIDIVEEEI